MLRALGSKCDMFKQGCLAMFSADPVCSPCWLCVQEESSEYETDSEEEGYGRRLLKPVFVPKESRDVRAGQEE